MDGLFVKEEEVRDPRTPPICFAFNSFYISASSFFLSFLPNFSLANRIFFEPTRMIETNERTLNA